jgi:NAD(P)-dependent dehydrogenase (short-subunit alcohol dehydrogenase family)
MKWDFKNKTAFITGGASGIGFKIAMDMAQNGANVAFIDLNKELGEKTLAELQKISNSTIKFYHGSVSDKEFVDGAVNSVFEDIGEIDFLINSAGILRDFYISRFDEKLWDLTIEVNLKGTAICTQAVVTKWVSISRAKAKENGVKKLPVLENKPRVIVNMSSLAADGNAGQMAYSASKAGIVGMTLTMAKELSQYNVRAHVIKPTMIETPIIGDFLSKNDGKFREVFTERIPFGIGEPSFVSNPVCFLCSEGGFFMTGGIFEVNGGKPGAL